MNREDDFELRLAEFLEAGPFEAPDHVVSAAIEHARTHPQRRLLRSAFWRSAMDSMHVAPVTPRHSNNVGRAFAIGLAAVVVVAAIALGATLLRGGGTTPAPGGIPAPAPTSTLTPTAVPVTGASSCSVEANGSDTIDGDIEEIRGLVLACRTGASDSRVVGDMAVRTSIDIRPDRSADMWGTASIAGPDGNWSGAWTGLVEKGYAIHRMAALLEGSGAYEGLQYRFTQTGNASGSSSDYELSGVIEPVASFEAVTPLTTNLAVSGTEACGSVQPGTSGSTELVNGVTQERNGFVSCTESMSDSRVAGDSTRSFNSDTQPDGSASWWGTAEITNSGGTWTGVWSGSLDTETNVTIAGSFIGSGSFTGLEYRVNLVSPPGAADYTVTGTIAPVE